MNRDEFEQHWRDERNWRYRSLFYYCPEDSRVVVPKRLRRFGWTVNFAHRLAYAAILFFIIIAVVPTLILIFAGITAISIIVSALALSILAVVSLAHYLSTPR